MKNRKEKELSPAQAKRLLEFNRLREELLAEGYQETVVSLSVLKANVMVLATSLPIMVVLFLLFSLVHPGGRWFTIFDYDYFLFLGAFVLAIVVHELIHGLTWSLYCKEKWNSISFGFIWKFLTPYCTCGECLPFRGYFLGTLMPTLLLGFLPYGVALATGSSILMLFSICMILCGGGDLYLLWLIRKHKSSILIDHPYSVGCVAFTKQ